MSDQIERHTGERRVESRFSQIMRLRSERVSIIITFGEKLLTTGLMSVKGANRCSFQFIKMGIKVFDKIYSTVSFHPAPSS